MEAPTPSNDTDIINTLHCTAKVSRAAELSAQFSWHKTQQTQRASRASRILPTLCTTWHPPLRLLSLSEIYPDPGNSSTLRNGGVRCGRVKQAECVQNCRPGWDTPGDRSAIGGTKCSFTMPRSGKRKVCKEWKTATVAGVYENGPGHRPVSLICISCKYRERFIIRKTYGRGLFQPHSRDSAANSFLTNPLLFRDEVVKLPNEDTRSNSTPWTWARPSTRLTTISWITKWKH